MVLPSDVVEQDPDMEALEGDEGAESMADGPTEGAVVPMETETGEVHFSRQFFFMSFQQSALSIPSASNFYVHIESSNAAKSKPYWWLIYSYVECDFGSMRFTLWVGKPITKQKKYIATSCCTYHCWLGQKKTYLTIQECCYNYVKHLFFPVIHLY